MVTRNYKKYMRSERWQKKRLMCFGHYGKRCYACRTIKGPIQVHHLDYTHFGNERVQDLMPLCVDCHKRVTWLYKKNRKRGLRRVTYEFVQDMRKQISEQRRPRI